MPEASQENKEDLRVNNEFWKLRSSHGRKPKFESPEDLWGAACEYFQWVTDNPLLTVELVKFQGEAKQAQLPKIRAMTEIGLCNFLNIGQSTWNDYKNKRDFSEVTTRISNIIYQQKFEGAAADLLNPNIIARELGLADSKKVDLDVNDKTDHRATMAQILSIISDEDEEAEASS